MRAVVSAGAGAVTVADIAEPVVQDPGDAVVEVQLAAVCGTDLHVVRGPSGVVLGHEFVGVVRETGPGVHLVKPGDRVMASDFTACGVCWYCREERHWHCPHRQFFGTGAAFGPELAGAQAERVRVPFADTTLAPVPAGVSDEAALLIGDNLATGWVALTESCLRPGDVVAVLGGGAVGQLASLTAQVLGAGVVVVSDPVAARRDLARAQGAVAVTPESLVADLAGLTDGRGADVVVEAVGNARGLESALDAVRPGGQVVSVSAHEQARWDFPLAAAFTCELALRFVIGDSIRTRRELLRVVAAGVLAPEVVISGRIPLEAAESGYRDLQELRAVKILLVP